ncbi:PIP5K6 [Symbiodinium sp. CCMP2456]|nr:PIP5K6 [Symbiodinium sp. CCMP2456]
MENYQLESQSCTSRTEAEATVREEQDLVSSEEDEQPRLAAKASKPISNVVDKAEVSAEVFELPEVDPGTVVRWDIPGCDAFVLDGVLSETECHALRSSAEGLWTFWEDDPARPRISFRNAHTVEVTHQALADRIWRRVAAHVQPKVELGPDDPRFEVDIEGTWCPYAMNPKLLLSRYLDGGHFSPHTDGTTVVDFNRRTFYSCVLFLNPSPWGGHTRLYADEQMQRELQMDDAGRLTGDRDLVLAEVAPKSGRMLVFYHRLMHEGIPAAEKYIIRTDVLYRRHPEICTAPEDVEAFQMYQEAQLLAEKGDCAAAAGLFRGAFRRSAALKAEGGSADFRPVGHTKGNAQHLRHVGAIRWLSTTWLEHLTNAAFHPEFGRRGVLAEVSAPSSGKDRQVSGSPLTLPDLLYTAACGGDLDPASLDVQCDMSLSDGSELPEPLRLTFRDEHPLMLGSANVCAQLQSLVLGGHAALRQDLPMQRKRDLLQLPTADFRFKAALSLEEETSFVDDGFSTVSFRGVEGEADGRLWSDSEDCLQMEAEVSANGNLAVKTRAASFVQALIEAETAAARLNASRTGSADAAQPRNRHQSETIGADEDAPYTSVRAGDAVFLEVGGSASVTTRGMMRLLRPGAQDGASSPVSRGRREAEKLTVADIADDLHTLEGPSQTPMLRASLARSEANMKLGEFRAQVGDIVLAIPSTAEVKLKVVEAEINAEGIGQTHLQISWDGLGRPHLKHTAKQRSVTFPQPPSASGLTVRIGDMGQMGITLDDEPDVAECGNRLLDDEAWFVPLLELADTMNLQPAVKRLLNLSRVVRNVLRTEGIEEPKDVIPTRRMARVIARILQEIGTDGKHVADGTITKLEDDIRGVVEGAVLGKGLDVAKITRLLWDHLPTEALNFVQEYTAEVDFVIKWFDSVLRPTEPTSGPDPSKSNEQPPSQKYRRKLEEVAPCASSLYDAVERPTLLSQTMEDQLRRAAPYLTAKQVEHVLRSSQLEPSLRHRLKFLLGLKRRVEKVAEGYGGPAFMPQGMAVGFFLATAIRASFAGTDERNKVGGSRILQGKAVATTLSARLASVLREQKAVATELCRLQERQKSLAEQALQLAGLSNAPAQAAAGNVPMPNRLEERPFDAGEVPSSMLTCLAADGLPPSHSAAIGANAARFAQSQAASTSSTPANLPSLSRSSDGSQTIFDLGTSLLGPTEVAILLQSGLAAVPQGRQVITKDEVPAEKLVPVATVFSRPADVTLADPCVEEVLQSRPMVCRRPRVQQASGDEEDVPAEVVGDDWPPQPPEKRFARLQNDDLQRIVVTDLKNFKGHIRSPDQRDMFALIMARFANAEVQEKLSPLLGRVSMMKSEALRETGVTAAPPKGMLPIIATWRSLKTEYYYFYFELGDRSDIEFPQEPLAIEHWRCGRLLRIATAFLCNDTLSQVPAAFGRLTDEAQAGADDFEDGDGLVIPVVSRDEASFGGLTLEKTLRRYQDACERAANSADQKHFWQAFCTLYASDGA